jgi:hypothetical protein
MAKLSLRSEVAFSFLARSYSSVVVSGFLGAWRRTRWVAYAIAVKTGPKNAEGDQNKNPKRTSLDRRRDNGSGDPAEQNRHQPKIDSVAILHGWSPTLSQNRVSSCTVSIDILRKW